MVPLVGTSGFPVHHYHASDRLQITSEVSQVYSHSLGALHSSRLACKEFVRSLPLKKLAQVRRADDR
jgi:hypothetical protein